jgi:hypothetical protein
MSVKVWDETVEIEVVRRSKAVWVASGRYNGKYHEVKRATASAAVSAWANVAKAAEKHT